MIRTNNGFGAAHMAGFTMVVGIVFEFLNWLGWSRFNDVTFVWFIAFAVALVVINHLNDIRASLHHPRTPSAYDDDLKAARAYFAKKGQSS